MSETIVADGGRDDGWASAASAISDGLKNAGQQILDNLGGFAVDKARKELGINESVASNGAQNSASPSVSGSRPRGVNQGGTPLPDKRVMDSVGFWVAAGLVAVAVLVMLFILVTK